MKPIQNAIRLDKYLRLISLLVPFKLLMNGLGESPHAYTKLMIKSIFRCIVYNK